MNKTLLNKALQSKVVQSYGPLYPIYVKGIYETINQALNAYPRLLAVRFDLRLPDEDLQDYLTNYNPDAGVITRFIASLEARIEASLKRRKKAGKRTFPCEVRYAWAREFNAEGKKHYHVLLMINRDAYLGFGGYGRNLNVGEQPEGLALMVYKAWISAIGLEGMKYKKLVFFPSGSCYHIFKDSYRYEGEYIRLMQRTLYLAKKRSKSNEDGYRNFGRSVR